MARSDDLVIIQITANNTRTLEQKKALFARMAELLGESPGMRPETSDERPIRVKSGRPLTAASDHKQTFNFVANFDNKYLA